LTEGINGRNLLHGRHLVRETLLFLLVTLGMFIQRQRSRLQRVDHRSDSGG
jgi:hypothetical protein